MNTPRKQLQRGASLNTIFLKSAPFLVFVITGLTYALYLPGQSAGFIFDDYGNLDKLSDLRTGFQGLYDYLRTTTRPIAFLSFLIDDNSWPSIPESFIHTNILLHIASGLVLCAVLLKTLSPLNYTPLKSQGLALFASTLWMIHPLFVSTTLYTVQRMTILSALFVLLGILFYLYGREQLTKGRKSGYYLLIFGPPVLGILGVLSKQNAVLLPIYLLLFELTVFSSKPVQNRFFKYWKSLYIYLPVVLLVLVAIYTFPIWIKPYDIRSFSIDERLFTQFRILCFYLYLIIIPHSSTNGLHYENYPISSNFFDPITTVTSLIAITFLIVLAISNRKKHPLISLSILFFFSGHLIESTVYPLELYYEHRNYLPSVFIFLAIALGVAKLATRSLVASFTGALLLVLVFGYSTYYRSSLWGDQLLLLAIWTENNPTSARNYGEAALIANNQRRPDIARKFMEQGARSIPDDPHLLIGLISYSCQDLDLKKEDLDRLKELAKNTPQVRSVYLYRNLKGIVQNLDMMQCQYLNGEYIRELILILLDNPNIDKYDIRKQELLHLLGIQYLNEKDVENSVKNFLNSLQFNPQPDVALNQIAQLASHGHYEAALSYLIATRKLIFNDASRRSNPYGLDQFNELEDRLKIALYGINRNNTKY